VVYENFRTPEYYFCRLVSLFRSMARFVTLKGMNVIFRKSNGGLRTHIAFKKSRLKESRKLYNEQLLLKRKALSAFRQIWGGCTTAGMT